MNFFLSRRRFLGHAGLLAATALTLPARAGAAPVGMRSLAFVHLHTGERIETVYAVDDSYLAGSLQALDRFMRDHYTGEIGTIDPLLFDQLHAVQTLLGHEGPFEVISGYRCAETNERLRLAGGGGVARRSLHMDGRAVDVRLPGVTLAGLRDVALTLQAGGVGYYPVEQFVHLDTGRVRSW